MKKITLFILIIFLFITNLISIKSENSNEPNIQAHAAILIDAKSGTVLYEKNSREKMFPASITKILTVYLSVTNLDPEQVVEASEEAIFSFDRNSSHLWLSPKEQFKVKDLQYASFLASANDASNILAESVSGSLEKFVELMNNTVSDLNLADTHFNNAHGLPDENHYTSAYDMAMITRFALKNPEFKKIYETSSYTMEKTNKEDERQLATGNKMIKNSEFKYEYATGGKIGWTTEAGYTYVASASKDNMDLIAVVLKDDDANSRYTDAKALFEYGFNNYKTYVVKGSEIPEKVVEIKKDNSIIATAKFFTNLDFNILLPHDKDESSIQTDIIIKNENDIDNIEGYLSISIDGKSLGEQLIDKEINVNEKKLEEVKRPLSIKFFDYFSIFVLGIFLFRSFILLTIKIKTPE